ncbi:hypothetical protein CONLIGDRAFT_675173 [Coniochaeta ligniaria NRRL 30616]|uniref:Uncharacterized protein n=1 Tax=Coniochaeta ligniaria NRRL 30616 TaxID=1408157 RepID=A0A1J7J3W7_9PEZI|nr:hypothetical protein CONLIGDRAFT_675173 [Coniochaeta ligniaria NRRL 30616]
MIDDPLRKIKIAKPTPFHHIMGRLSSSVCRNEQPFRRSLFQNETATAQCPGCQKHPITTRSGRKNAPGGPSLLRSRILFYDDPLDFDDIGIEDVSGFDLAQKVDAVLVVGTRARMSEAREVVASVSAILVKVFPDTRYGSILSHPQNIWKGSSPPEWYRINLRISPKSMFLILDASAQIAERMPNCRCSYWNEESMQLTDLDIDLHPAAIVILARSDYVAEIRDGTGVKIAEDSHAIDLTSTRQTDGPRTPTTSARSKVIKCPTCTKLLRSKHMSRHKRPEHCVTGRCDGKSFFTIAKWNYHLVNCQMNHSGLGPIRTTHFILCHVCEKAFGRVNLESHVNNRVSKTAATFRRENISCKATMILAGVNSWRGSTVVILSELLSAGREDITRTELVTFSDMVGIRTELTPGETRDQGFWRLINTMKKIETPKFLSRGW